MKIRLTFKTPDVSAYALQDLYLRFKDEGLERVQKSISKYTRDDEYLMIETDYKDEEEREEALEKAQRAIARYVRDDEYLTVEIDTETQEILVVPVVP